MYLKFTWKNDCYLRYQPEKGLIQHALISSIFKDLGHTISIKQLEEFDKLARSGKLDWHALTEELYIKNSYEQIVITTRPGK